jgi:RNA polymerase sigma-70 factor (ECF subfamily)
MPVVTAAEPGPTPGALLAAVARGDQAAFRALYREFAPSAYGLALRVTGDEHLAQDVLQEAFADVWAQAGRFDPALSSARAWVTMLTHRRAVDRVRREQSDRDRVTRWASTRGDRDHDGVAEVVALRAEHRQVRAALAGLSRLQREAVELAFVAGLTHHQVAAELDIPLGTAKTRIRDGLRGLRAALEEGA